MGGGAVCLHFGDNFHIVKKDICFYKKIYIFVSDKVGGSGQIRSEIYPFFSTTTSSLFV